MPRRQVLRPSRLALTAAALFSTLALTAGAALAVVVPASASFPEAIDSPAAYQGQATCSPTVKPGTGGLRSLLLNTYAGTRDLGIVRDCTIGGTSEHKEGRAFDWGVSVTSPTEKAEADAFIGWLLAPDKYGNKFAMARRLGIMYMIWNQQIWGAYNPDAGWRPYTGADPHTTHVHISLSWDGANKHTTWWDPAVQTSLSAALEAARECPVQPKLAAPVLDTSASQFVAVTPVRLVDSRTGLGIADEPNGCRLAPGGRLDVKVLGTGGVPDDGSVTSAVINVTQVAPKSISFLSAYPAGSAWPGTSVVNAAAGGTAAAGTVVPVGTDGKVSLLNGSGSSHLVVDLVGYFTKKPTDTFHAVLPIRAMDSRDSTAFADGETRTLQIAGKTVVPTSAKAIVANVTVVGGAAASYVTVWPSSTTRPLTSSVNVGPRAVVPNRVISGLGPDGAVQIYADKSADVIVDVTGWFGGATGSEYHAMQPTRAVDSRYGVGTGGVRAPVPAGSTLDVNLQGTVPSTATAAAVTITGVNPDRATFVTVWPSGPTPGTSDLNLRAGGTSANMGLEGLVDRHFLIRPDTATMNLIVDVTGWFGPALGDAVASRVSSPSPSSSPSPKVSTAPTTLVAASASPSASPSASQSG